MTLAEILHPRVDEGYCMLCTDYSRKVCVICNRCDKCGHKTTCPNK
jgi:hypothetical protein